MNQELIQRIIGAVVVTAMAALFVPMLFDDPVNDSSQAVSELSIPKEPVVTIDALPEKFPDNANQALPTPDIAPENSINNEELSAEPLNDNESSPPSGSLEPDTETLDGNIISEEEELKPADNEEEASDVKPSKPLDTKVIKSTLKPLKKSEKNIDDDIEVEVKPKKTVKHTDLDAVDLEPVIKHAAPIKSVVVNSPEKVVKKPLPNTTAELQRWTIQAGSFSKKENAVTLYEKLRKQGFPVSMETKGSLYRLKIAPTLDKKRALAMKSKLDQLQIKTILIAE
jgi:DedD protein